MSIVLSEDFQETLEKCFGSNLSEQTKKKYGAILMKWMEYSKKYITDLLNNPLEANGLLQSFPISHTPENHHTYLTPMIAYIHYVAKDDKIEKEWKEYQRRNWEPIQQRYDENRPSERQKENIMSFEEILRIRESLEKGSIERLLLSFYTLLEPNRADYFATELIKTGQQPTEENYIIDNIHLILKDFKTKSVYKQLDNILPVEIQEELQESLKNKPRRYLFTREDNSAYPDRKQYSTWACRTLTRVLKHPMTLTTLRHLFISQHMQNKSPSELTEMAKKMGHTRSMQRAYEWISPDEQQ